MTALLTAVIGLAAAWYYASLDLTLSHYDARGHVMVARRVFDNLTPGWIQLGAVWLPLPHVLNAVPAQWDWSYRTGATGVLLSVGILAWGLGLLASWVAGRTGSVVLAACVTAAVLLNPNVLYLQATPMTEPLLFGLSAVAVFAADRWLSTPGAAQTRLAGAALAALVLTRYEGWCIVGALAGLAVLAHPRQAWRLLAWPFAAVVWFLLHSYGSTGTWFTTGGFFEANNPALGDPWLAWSQVVEAAESLSHPWLLRAGFLGVAACLAGAWFARRDGRDAIARALLPVALLAAVALPMYAYLTGHPVRVRYSVSLVVACTVTAVWALAWLPSRLRSAAAIALTAALLVAVPPLDAKAPMVVEAQWERPHSDARRAVTAALAAQWDGTPVMASMGSLGHYMQQMAHAGFALEDFLHEGNGEIWKAAFVSPTPYVRWVLVEESAEGGDALAQRARVTPGYFAAFDRIAEGGGVALYRRRSD